MRLISSACNATVMLLAISVGNAERAFGQRSGPEPQFELAAAAPGCPNKLPTYDSVSGYCKPFDERSCSSARVCSWSNAWQAKDGTKYPGSCHPRTGMHIPTPQSDPEEMASIGLPSISLAVPEPAEKLASKAYDAAANKQYDRALLLYSQAVKGHPEGGDYQIMRGLVHEYNGDRVKAIADYCDGLLRYVDWQSQEIAKERVAQLTQADVERLPTPKFMRNGVLRTRKGREALAPLKIKTPSGGDYLIKLTNLKDGVEEMLIYIRAESEFETKVPFGSYSIRGASGAIWYGEPRLFGKNTRYFKFTTKADKDEVFPFVRDGNIAKGRFLSLLKVKEGNMESPTIRREEF